MWTSRRICVVHDQAERQSWRTLVLILKAKLEMVEAGSRASSKSS